MASFLVSSRAIAQEDIKSKQAELSKLRKEVERFEEKIKDREKTEHVTLELLDTYDRQATAIRKLIRRLRDEELLLQRGIDTSRETIQDLNGQISYLKKHYANYVSTNYRYGRTYDLELLLSSRSVNQALIRSEYLKRFSEQRKNDLNKISEKRESIEDRSRRLQQQLAEARELAAEKHREESKLTTQVKKRKDMLATVRRDKKLLRQEIQRSLNAAKELEQLIAKLIEQDRIKKEREAAAAVKDRKSPSLLRSTATTFDDKRGKMRWPVTQGKVVARFGNQQHPVLKTITQNTGIDINLPPGSDVHAVSEGEVSMIYFLPPYGNLIILNHFGGYRTVYAHLSDIAVVEGQKISEGYKIGRSGESISGPLLHFEIWKDREKQDPESWLTPRGLTQR